MQVRWCVGFRESHSFFVIKDAVHFAAKHRKRAAVMQI